MVTAQFSACASGATRHTSASRPRPEAPSVVSRVLHFTTSAEALRLATAPSALPRCVGATCDVSPPMQPSHAQGMFHAAPPSTQDARFHWLRESWTEDASDERFEETPARS